MHRYEVMFIIRPDLPEEEIEKLVSQMEGYVAAAGGKIEKTEKMGRRKLAYRISRQRDGFYVLLILEGVPGTVVELERRLRVTDTVLKFITIRTDEEQKRGAKLAQIREKKAARRKAGPAHSPAPAAEASQQA
ncbi:MAG TPA: 30S ribosomal protein S6 [Terriglobia bacterium]|nr:30S ribosomal protein S6 [Terriglobia bacterium]